MTKQQRPTDARTRILDAAAEVFAERGFAGARVDNIAERARVNKAMLYYHVGDKAALYREVLTRNFDLVLTSLQRAAATASSPEGRLRAFITTLVSEAGGIDNHAQMMMQEIATGGVNLDPEIVARILAILQHLVDIIEDGVDAGVFRPTNPVMTHLTVVGAMIFMTSVAPIVGRLTEAAPARVRDAATWTPEELSEHLFSVLTRGLSPTPHQGAD